MTYNDNDGYKAVQQTVGDRVSAARNSRPYRYGTLGLSILVIGTIIAGAVWVFFTNRGNGGTDAGDTAIPTIGSGGVTPAPGADTKDLFAAPSADVYGRVLEVPLNPMGAVLPQRPGKASSNPAAVPEGLTWQLVYNAAMPFSTSDGPSRIGADGVPTGFAQTTKGAILAGMQAMRRTIAAPAPQVSAIRAQMVTYPPRVEPSQLDQLFSLSLSKDEVFAGSPVPLAFKVTEARKDYVHFEIANPVASSLQSKNIVAIRTWTDMVWRDGQWKWVASPVSNSPETRYVYGALDESWTRW